VAKQIRRGWELAGQIFSHPDDLGALSGKQKRDLFHFVSLVNRVVESVRALIFAGSLYACT
jgi:hypothetical protein